MTTKLKIRTANLISLNLLFIFLITINSCNDYDTEKSSEIVSLSKGEAILSFSGLPISSGSPICRTVGNDSLLTLDLPTNSIVLFDLNSERLLSQTTLTLNGPDFVDFPIFDIDFFNNQFYVLSKNYISVFGQDSKVIKRINLKEIPGANDDFFIRRFEMITPSKGIFSKNLSSAEGIRIPNQETQTIFFVMDIFDFNISQLAIYSPEEALVSDLENGYYFGHSDHFLLAREEEMIYNFRFSSKVYRYNFKTQKTSFYSGEHKNIDPVRESMPTKDIQDTKQLLKYANSGPKFSQVLFDDRTNLYVRLDTDYSKDAKGQKLISNYLIIFNEYFEKVHKVEVNERIWQRLIVNNGTVYLEKLDQLTESGLEFITYDLKRN